MKRTTILYLAPDQRNMPGPEFFDDNHIFSKF